MARTTEKDLPVAPEYLTLLKEQISELGRDRIAGIAKIDPTTVHRNINDGNLTYTTALKLRDAIAAAYQQDTGAAMRWVPPPFYPVVSQGHYDLCEIAAKLHGLDGKAFGELFEKGVQLLNAVHRDRVLDDAKIAIANPIPGGQKKKDRGD